MFVQNATSSAYFDCSGSVLDSLHVLTAAHCVYDDAGNLAQPSQLSVTAGVSNEATPLSTDLEQDRMVSSFTVHPGYSYNATDPGPDDVAVIALASPLDLSGPAVKAVALPSPAAPFPSGAAVIDAGFGEETSGEQPSGQLNSLAANDRSAGAVWQRRHDRRQRRPLLRIVPHECDLPRRQRQRARHDGFLADARRRAERGAAGLYALDRTSTYTYVAAPEIFDYIQGNQQPPAAPREDETTFVNLNWDRPLVVGTTAHLFGRRLGRSARVGDLSLRERRRTGTAERGRAPPTRSGRATSAQRSHARARRPTQAGRTSSRRSRRRPSSRPHRSASAH